MPLPLALLSLFWLRKQNAAALKFFMALIFFFVLEGGLSVIYWGWHPLVFNFVTYSFSIPWGPVAGPLGAGGDWGAQLFPWLKTICGEWFRFYSPFVVLLAWVALHFKREDIFANWFPPLWVAAWGWPASIAGRLKAQGGSNNYSVCVAFLFLGLAAYFGRKISSHRLATLALLFLFGAWQVGILIPLGQRIAVQDNPQKMASRFLRDHPGEVWFPEFPHLHLAGEGHLFHSGYGIYDFFRGPHRLSREAVRNFVPPQMRWLALQTEAGSEARLYYFPEFTKEVPNPSLPGWRIYEGVLTSSRYYTQSHDNESPARRP